MKLNLSFIDKLGSVVLIARGRTENYGKTQCDIRNDLFHRFSV